MRHFTTCGRTRDWSANVRSTSAPNSVALQGLWPEPLPAKLKINRAICSVRAPPGRFANLMRRRQIREALGSEREALLSQLTEQMVSRSQTKQPCFFFFFPRPVEAENIALVRLLNLSGAGLWGNLTYVHEQTKCVFH